MIPIKEIRCATAVQLGSTAEVFIQVPSKAESITYFPEEMKFVVKSSDKTGKKVERWVFGTNVQYATPLEAEVESDTGSSSKTRTRKA